MVVHEKAAENIIKGDPEARVTNDLAQDFDHDFSRLGKISKGGWATPELIPSILYQENTLFGEVVF